jgi:hypothetical protein
MVEAGHNSNEPPAGESRWAPFRVCADELPPPTDEAALATLIGVVALIVSNAIAITVVVPFIGIGNRLQHHLFDALELAALAIGLALPFWLLARAKLGKHMLGWFLYAALSSGIAYFILALHLRRQATALLDGKLYTVAYPFYVILCGGALLAAYFMGAYFARLGRTVSRWFHWGGAAIGLAAIIVAHSILRDDYPGVHAAIMWGAMVVFGSSLALVTQERFGAFFEKRRVPMYVFCVAVAVIGIAVTPSNAVRQQMFRECGAVAPWVLARAVWALPEVDVEAEAPSHHTHDEEIYRHATLGIQPEPVVVFLTVDALRADVLRDTANNKRFPWLSWLRDRGTWFPNASSPGSQTSVSMTSAFTSRYFSQQRWSRFGDGRKRFLYAADDTTVRWPELLAEAGVATHSVLGLIFLQGRYGIVRGFEDEKIVVKGRRHATAHAVMTPLLKKLKAHKEGPALFYAHLMEPHEPYDRGKLKEGSAWERYLSEIEQVDVWVGRLISAIKKKHRRRGYIILSADHGEAFGEHGTKYHTKTLYEELVNVPLIMWGPGFRRHVVDDRVSLVDVGPTLLHMFRVPPPEGAAGVSLLPLARLQGGSAKRPVFAEGRLRRAMYTTDGLKVIEDTVRKVVEVYDLEADPGELHNLFDDGDERVFRAVAQLRAWYDEHTLRHEGYEPPYKP